MLARSPALRPPALVPGATVGIVAPSSSFPRDSFDEGVAWLEAQGLRVKWRPDLMERHYYLAGSRRRRLDELHAMFSDPEVSAIFCARGGFGLMHLLPDIDWDILLAAPKIFVGYSDLTPLLNTLVSRGMVSFLGPVMTGLTRKTSPDCQAQLLEVMSEVGKPCWRLEGGTCLRPGVVEAPACGGNLSMLAATAGTPWQVDPEGKILLIEDVGERPYRIDRLLTQLRLTGMLGRAAAIAIGNMEDCQEPGGRGRPLPEIYADLLGDLPIPVCYGLPFGHGWDNHTIPLGVDLHLDCGQGRLVPLSPAVSVPGRLPSLEGRAPAQGP